LQLAAFQQGLVLLKNDARLIVRESVIRNFIVGKRVFSALIAIKIDIGHKTNFTHFNVDRTLHLWQLNLLV